MTDNNSKLLLSGRYLPTDFEIKFNKDSNRKTNPLIEKEIQIEFLKRKGEADKKGIPCYDGTIYRLNNISKSPKLKLEFSTVKFSAMVSDIYIPEVRELGEDYYNKGSFTEGLIETKDNKFLFGVRSKMLNDWERIHIIGGVLSADEIDLTSSQDIFTALNNELEEEINIMPNEIETEELIAIILNEKHRIRLTLYVKLNLTKAEIEKKFKARKDPELQRLLFISPSKVEDFLINLDPEKVVIGKAMKDVKIIN